MRVRPAMWSLRYASEIDGSLPEYLSPSSLSVFQRCPRQYQHSRVEGLRDPDTFFTIRGKIMHGILERLHNLPGAQRTHERARTFIEPSFADHLTDQSREDMMRAGKGGERELRSAVDRQLANYFLMEDPSKVRSEGVEREINENLGSVPVKGIIDRLDREPDGSLSIVDYKSGHMPRQDEVDSKVANTELYAGLVQAATGELPKRIRLFHTGHSAIIEHPVTPVAISKRIRGAEAAWDGIQKSYDRGDFVALPSKENCMWCPHQKTCKRNGVDVPY